MSAHDNERLPLEIKENAAQQRHQQNQDGIYENTLGKYLKEVSLHRAFVKRPVDPYVVNNKIDGVTNEQPRQNLKGIGNENKHKPPDQMPFIFKKVFV